MTTRPACSLQPRLRAALPVTLLVAFGACGFFADESATSGADEAPSPTSIPLDSALTQDATDAAAASDTDPDPEPEPATASGVAQSAVGAPSVQAVPTAQSPSVEERLDRLLASQERCSAKPASR
jgi:hypothetical protein